MIVLPFGIGLPIAAVGPMWFTETCAATADLSAARPAPVELAADAIAVAAALLALALLLLLLLPHAATAIATAVAMTLSTARFPNQTLRCISSPPYRTTCRGIATKTPDLTSACLYDG